MTPPEIWAALGVTKQGTMKLMQPLLDAGFDASGRHAKIGSLHPGMKQRNPTATIQSFTGNSGRTSFFMASRPLKNYYVKGQHVCFLSVRSLTLRCSSASC